MLAAAKRSAMRGVTSYTPSPPAEKPRRYCIVLPSRVIVHTGKLSAASPSSSSSSGSSRSISFGSTSLRRS